MVRNFLTGVGFVCFAALVGCGETFTPPPGVIVKGKLLQDGQPLPQAPAPESGNGPVVTFFADGLADTNAFTDASGNFTVDYAGEGIPPGKYKVAVAVWQGGPGSDALQGKVSREVTTIEVDVPQDKLGKEHDVGVIDIGPFLK